MNSYIILIAIILLTYLNGDCQEAVNIQPNQDIDCIDCKGVTEYSVLLKKGEYALFNLKQMGVDLYIVTRDPSGNIIDKFDSVNGSVGDEHIVIDADASGHYKLLIAPFDESNKYSFSINYVHKTSHVGKHFNEAMKTLSARGFLPGFAYSIVSKDKLIYEGSSGFADRDQEILYNKETVQKIASISKTTIGIALLQLVEQGLIDFDTDINQYLPFSITNPYCKEEVITIRHLATHTSGINESKFYDKVNVIIDDTKGLDITALDKETQKMITAAMKNKQLSLKEYLGSTLIKKGKHYRKKNFFKRSPGKSWYYSNTGAALAAFIVEEVSGLSYDAYTQQNIFEPIGITTALWDNKKDVSAKLSKHYTCNNIELPVWSSLSYPDGGLQLSNNEMTKYLQTIMQGYYGADNILKATSWQQIMSVQHKEVDEDGIERKVGLFWDFAKTNNLMGHSGGDFGILTMMYFDPLTGIGYTFQTNTLVTECGDSYAQFQKLWSTMKRYGNILN